MPPVHTLHLVFWSSNQFVKYCVFFPYPVWDIYQTPLKSTFPSEIISLTELVFLHSLCFHVHEHQSGVIPPISVCMDIPWPGQGQISSWCKSDELSWSQRDVNLHQQTTQAAISMSVEGECKDMWRSSAEPLAAVQGCHGMTRTSAMVGWSDKDPWQMGEQWSPLQGRGDRRVGSLPRMSAKGQRAAWYQIIQGTKFVLLLLTFPKTISKWGASVSFFLPSFQWKISGFWKGWTF